MKGLFSFFLFIIFWGGETHAPKSDARIPEDSAERDPLTASPPTEKIQLSTPVKSTVPRLISRMRALSSSTRFPLCPTLQSLKKFLYGERVQLGLTLCPTPRTSPAVTSLPSTSLIRRGSSAYVRRCVGILQRGSAHYHMITVQQRDEWAIGSVLREADICEMGGGGGGGSCPSPRQQQQPEKQHPSFSLTPAHTHTHTLNNNKTAQHRYAHLFYNSYCPSLESWRVYVPRIWMFWGSCTLLLLFFNLKSCREDDCTFSYLTGFVFFWFQ